MQVISPLFGFSQFANVKYSMGCADVECKNESMIIPATEAAKNADATVIVAGINTDFESEGLDRLDLNLPGYQNQLIKQVADISKGPVILVIMSAGGVDISFAKGNDSKITSIIWAGQPGEQGGHAIAEAIFGKYNPGGKLPITWYENSYIDMLPMTSMSLRPVDELGYHGRTYKFFNGSTLYPFGHGHGLSYTQFNYKTKSAQRSIGITFDACRKNWKRRRQSNAEKMKNLVQIHREADERRAMIQAKLEMNPAIFVHGVLNGAYGAPFFV